VVPAPLASVQVAEQAGAQLAVRGEPHAVAAVAVVVAHRVLEVHTRRTDATGQIVPHWNLRGNAQTGTYANGARHRCLDAQGTRCVALDWAEGWFPYNPARPIPEHWHGSLLTEKRDGSGLLYRRNRYYDPSTSRFTQEDPIGLAGGLNLYGFAAGDPVTYRDPFGLCPARLKRNGRCPGGLDIDAEWNSVQDAINTLRPGRERNRLQRMLERGRIVRVQQTRNGTPALAILGSRSGHSIQVADGFFTGNAPGYETGYDTPGERGWSLGHEFGHFVQWEEGRLISEIGTSGLRGNRGRIRTMLEAQARAENPELQRDADIMGCRLATDPGIWANKC
jgi:RHS repeat-associated protein